ncbi:trypsin-like peptidase domain-containing protein [Candidatus Woesearchaeota archaeon]|nr:trypsin-like peptidase domain-containing protein [Candidatus Woesearchaeota archaeon]
MAEKQLNELEDYIKTQRSLGVNEHAIRKSMLDAGYTEQEFGELLKRHYAPKARQAGGGFNPTVKHVIYINIALFIAVAGLVSYFAYDYNTKLADMSSERQAQMTEMDQKITSHADELSQKIVNVEGALRSDVSTANARIDSVGNQLDTKLQDYNYQSMRRDAQLSDSIQKSSNHSLSELATFSQQLNQFREASVDFSQVIPSAISAVVTIGSRGNGYFNTAGSGVFISNEGYVVTNYHVVDDLSRITVRTHDDAEYTANIVGKDEDWDIAVIKLQTEKNDFERLQWADSSKAKVGDPVIAVGNPVGFESTVTQGIISNTKRLIPGDVEIYYLQTDVAINAGNSGGPLIDKDGKIVGIATLKYAGTGFEGLSFALRSNDVQGMVLNMLKEE